MNSPGVVRREAWSQAPVLELEDVSASYYADERTLAEPQIKNSTLR